MQAAIQSSLADYGAEVFADLEADAEFRKTPGGRSFVEKLARQTALSADKVTGRLLLTSLDGLGADEQSLKLALVRAMMEGLKRPKSGLRELEAEGALAAIDGVVSEAIASATKTSLDAKAEVKRRVRAIDDLGLGKFADVKPTLTKLIDSREPHEVQLAAVAVLGKFADPGAADILLAAWPKLSPQLKEPATEVLFARPERIVSLFDAIDAGRVPQGDLAPARLQLLAKSKNDTLRSRAEKFLAAVKPGRRQDVVEAYRDVLQLAGDVARGQAAFRKTCSVCHKAGGFGTEIGPNLTAIKTRGPEAILTNVLDPSREVNPLYVNYVCVTSDGRTLTGLIAAESAASVTLRRAEGASDTVLRVDIDELQSTGLSIMPEGLEKQLDKQTMADVIAYLMQLQ
jgi:putative heme-binding domain-containing protein